MDAIVIITTLKMSSYDFIANQLGISLKSFIVIITRICFLDITNTWGDNTAMQSQKTVSAYFKSEQILPFDFAEHNISRLLHKQCIHYKWF